MEYGVCFAFETVSQSRLLGARLETSVLHAPISEDGSMKQLRINLQIDVRLEETPPIYARVLLCRLYYVCETPHEMNGESSVTLTTRCHAIAKYTAAPTVSTRVVCDVSQSLRLLRCDGWLHFHRSRK